jgi:hypothetical protein
VTEAIEHRLSINSIEYVSNGHGPSYGEAGGSVYYEISVRIDQYERARGLVTIRQKQSKKEVKCPHWGYDGYRLKSNGTILLKLYYLGTQLAECKKCMKNLVYRKKRSLCVVGGLQNDWELYWNNRHGTLFHICLRPILTRLSILLYQWGRRK